MEVSFECEIRNIPHMEAISKEWLQQRLTGRRGEISELAEAIGLEPNKVTKILSGARGIKSAEAAAIAAYFASKDGDDELLDGKIQRLPDALKERVDAYVDGLLAQVEGEDGPGGSIHTKDPKYTAIRAVVEAVMNDAADKGAPIAADEIVEKVVSALKGSVAD